MSRSNFIAAHRIRRRPPRRARRGMSIVLVMMIISVTLATAYVMHWSQTTTLELQQNSESRHQARQTALTAMSIALRKMHQSDWAGADTLLSGTLSSTERYEVTYTTGDATLTASHPDSKWWPYRVTLTASGYSSAGRTGVTALHRVRTVVQLRPRRLASEPSAWGELAPHINTSTGSINAGVRPHTVYQHTANTVLLNPPMKIEGTIRLRARLDLGTSYTWSSSARDRYFGDLNLMRQIGYPDYRTLTAQVYLPLSVQTSATLNNLTRLGVGRTDATQTSLAGWSNVGTYNTYRLYPGGKVFSVPRVSATLRYTTLAPDPQTNPAGVFFSYEDVNVRENVTLTGTLVSYADVQLNGENIRLQPASLPALEGTSEPVELPVLVVRDDVFVRETARASVTGMASIWDDFTFDEGTNAVSLDLAGQVVLGRMNVYGRTQSNLSSFVWSLVYSYFLNNLGNVGSILYLPVYASYFGADPTPRIVLQPRAEAIRNHWLIDGASIYIAHPSDGGLRWDLLRWEDGV